VGHTQTIGAYTPVLWPVLQSRSAETNKKMDYTPAHYAAHEAHDIALVNAHEVRNAALDAANDAHEAALAHADGVRNSAVDDANAAIAATMRAADDILAAALALANANANATTV